MILARLLSAGKSLVGGDNNPSRYQMGHPGLMPKFISSKNPFGAGKSAAATTAATDAGKVSGPLLTLTNSLEPQAGRGPDLPSLKGSAERGGEQEQKMRLSPSQAEPATFDAPPLKGAASKPGVFARVLNFIGRTLSGGSRGNAAAALSGAKPAVQGELSLDNIKVVRNDLSDTDLEIVAGRAKGATQRVERKTNIKRSTPEPQQEPAIAAISSGAGTESRDA